MRTRRARSIRIDRPTASTAPDGTHQVTARVQGREVAYRSTVPLTASAEAFLSAFLIPAMTLGRDLTIDAEVDEVWLENVERVRRFVRSTWPERRRGEIQAAGTLRRERAPEAGRALFFGGGVDSLFTLHEERAALDTLIFVGGFDVALDDADRLATVMGVDGRVAEASGKALCVIETNLRDHPLYRCATWLMLYGGALASVGHVLGRHVRSCMVSGWGHITGPLVHGSHPEIEPGWSSSAVSFAFRGHERSRLEMIQRMARWPVFQDHLRVCWEHRSEDLNCGRCEKCVRTRLELLAAGAVDEVRTFPRDDLAAAIDGVAGIAPPLVHFYEDLLARIDAGRVRESLRRLLARSPPKRSRLARLARRWRSRERKGGRSPQARGS